MMKLVPTTLALLTLGLLASPSVAAETVISPGGQPGVATKWSGSGKSITLTIKKDYSANEVADAIERAIPGARATGKGRKVLVKGIAKEELISALERVEIDPELDDIDAMLTSVQGLDADEGSGSSIRATKAAELAAAGKPPAAVVATVLEVRHKRFPVVALKVRLDEITAKGPGLQAGSTLTVLPLIRTKYGILDRTDKQSKANARAWYARPGDRVALKLEATDKSYWMATEFERAKRR
jgi:hypothetical protein